MRKGMFTVEVLISIFILFLVVTLSATSSKFLNQMLKQQDRYKELYIIIFSIKDKISNDICTKQQRVTGKMSGLEYVAQCTIVKESKGFVKDYDFEDNQEIIGYTGMYLFHLYEVDLEIVNYGYSINYTINRYSKAVNW